MSSFIIEGGHRLKGEIIPQGAKNEALQVICATLLTEEEVIIENVPNILDVNNLIGLLMAMGVEVCKLNKDSWSFKAANINQEYIQTEDFIDKCSSLRGSIMIIGPLLARFGRVSIPKPGGDKIGRRRLDTHFNAIQKLGAKLDLDEKNQLFCLSADQLKGCYILLDEASVTGTANLLMAAVMAEGETIIYNAACEPYVEQLSKMLVRMGARIEGIGSNRLTVQGVSRLSGCHHRLLPDMIEIGSFIGMAAMTASDITIKDVSLHNLGIIPESFRRLGIIVEQQGDDLISFRRELYHRIVYRWFHSYHFRRSWPGLTPDLLSVMLVWQPKPRVCAHPSENVESRPFSWINLSTWVLRLFCATRIAQPSSDWATDSACEE